MPTVKEIQESIRQKNVRIQELEIEVQEKDESIRNLGLRIVGLTDEVSQKQQQVERLTQELEEVQAKASEESSEEGTVEEGETGEESPDDDLFAKARGIVTAGGA